MSGHWQKDAWLQCDGDGCQETWPPSGPVVRSLRAAREASKDEGWGQRKRGGRLLDYCPKCAALTGKEPT